MKQLLFILPILFCYTLVAQTFEAKLNKNNVAIGERFQLTYTLDADGSNFQAPDLGAFGVLSGPNRSSSMQWVNGEFSSSLSYTFVLLAQAEGEYTINPARVKVNKNFIESNPLTVKVSRGKTRVQTNNRRRPTNPQSTPKPKVSSINDNLFMKLYVDKKDVVVGEQLIATYILYMNSTIVNYAHNRPVFNGFYAQEVELDPSSSLRQEVINGKSFTVATMKKVVLTPQKSGTIEVPALEMEMVIRVEDRKRGQSVFDQFFGSFRNEKVEIKSNSESIVVASLPSKSQPVDFTGAVGSFSLDKKLDRDIVGVNEAVNLTLSITGKGNIELISEPKVNFPPDFEVYDPKMKQSISVNGNGTSGSKTFEYVLIPRYAGQYELKPITVSYYDPSGKSFKQMSTGPISLEVVKPEGEEGQNDAAYVAPKKEDVQIIGQDIRFIRTSEPELKRQEDEFFGSGLFYGLTTLPFAGMGLAIFLISFVTAQQNDTITLRNRRAKSSSRKHLSKARKIISNEDGPFYEEISSALFGYLGDKLNIDPVNLSREHIDNALKERKVTEQLKNDLFKAIDECDMVRFAPGVVRSKDQMLADSTEIIERLEDEI